MQSETADVVLLTCRAPLPAPGRTVDALTEAARSQNLPAAAVTVNLSLDGGELYVYLWLREATRVERGPLARALAVATGAAEVEAARHVRLQDIRGASHGARAAFHYVVETDVVPEAETDLNDWYDREHLPGLAAVPGAIREATIMMAREIRDLELAGMTLDLQNMDQVQQLAPNAFSIVQRIKTHYGKLAVIA